MFRSLLQRLRPHQPELSLDDLRTSDMVLVSLKPAFCTMMLSQQQFRFSQAELESRKLLGTVVRAGRSTEHNCWLGEIHTVAKTPEGIRLNCSVVLEDEIDSVKVIARCT